MKLMLCELCGDVVSPGMDTDVPKSCKCGVHYVWVDSVFPGSVKVFSQRTGAAKQIAETGSPFVGEVYVLDISDKLLITSPSSSEGYRDLAGSHEHSLFKTMETCIVKARPGNMVDAFWSASLPYGWIT